MEVIRKKNYKSTNDYTKNYNLVKRNLETSKKL